MPKRLPILSLLLLPFAMPAWADADTLCSLGDGSGVTPLSHPISISQTQVGIQSPAEICFAGANLASGVVRSDATGFSVTSTGATSAISDIITVTGPAGGPVSARITWQIGGVSDGLNIPPAQRNLGQTVTKLRSRSMFRQVFGSTVSQGAIVDLVDLTQRSYVSDGMGGVNVTTSFNFIDEIVRPPQILMGSTLIPNPVQPPLVTYSAGPAAEGFQVTVEMDVSVSAGDRFEVVSELEATAGGLPGSRADMSNSASVSIDLPAGYGFSSDSGALLSDPPVSVPLATPIAQIALLLSLILVVVRRSGRFVTR